VSRLVVVGDTLLDRDIVGRVTRICPDAPVPVVDVDDEVTRPGGAGLAAVLARRAGADVVLVTSLADDAAGALIRLQLDAAGIRVIDLGRREPTVEKIRVLGGGTPVVRVDRAARPAAPLLWSEEVDDALRGAAAVLVSDYAGGFASAPRVREILRRYARPTPIVWDPHPRGRDPVPNARLTTPTEGELFAMTHRVVGSREFAAVESAAIAYRRRTRASAVAVTMGNRGAMLVDGGSTPLLVPVPAVSPGDSLGAGDCFAARAAAALANGAVVSEAVVDAVHGASEFVARGGVSSMAEPEQTPTDKRAANEVAAAIRARGGTIVATGGCFDLLHAGHVALLRAARRLGDCLVVFLNSDASVRRLKGDGRPCQPAADRAAILLALECVDAVEIFEDDTPVRSLGALQPDLFVKGGDYAADELPERAVLAQWGGQAVLLPYLSGRSTTALIEGATARAH
jgi:D-beta-D-heptose 7-phosphate kinase / D-beta-D-heptose 1-phosphate adenosyltransferase